MAQSSPTSKNIRRQSIISSLVIYGGFLVGLLNTYFFTKENFFTTEQYGLVSTFIAVASLIATLSTLAMPAYIYKFFPYYNDHLAPRKNDMITWALLVGLAGFILVTIIGLVFKDIVVRKYGTYSHLFVQYYYWVYPLSFGLTLYNILEAYTWGLQRSVLTNFLKEVEWRLFTTLIILLFIFQVIPDFDIFIKLYAFTYPGIAITLLVYLFASRKVSLTFKISKVSRRLFTVIKRFCAFMYGGSIIFTLSLVFDTMVIASVLPRGLEKAAIFGLAQILTSIIQAPQRSIVAASVPHLSQAWKDKKLETIQRIYQRSSINLLIFASGIFVLIALNYQQAIEVFGLNKDYALGFWAFILLGLTKVVDLGTGVNSQIIGTSTRWRFELTSGVVLLILVLPLTYIFTKRFDILGPAMAALVSTTVYNTLRVWFLWKNFKLFPFTRASVYTLLLAISVFGATWLLFANTSGWAGLFLRTGTALIVFGLGVVVLKLTPDLRPVLETLLKKILKRKPTV